MGAGNKCRGERMNTSNIYHIVYCELCASSNDWIGEKKVRCRCCGSEIEVIEAENDLANFKSLLEQLERIRDNFKEE